MLGRPQIFKVITLSVDSSQKWAPYGVRQCF